MHGKIASLDLNNGRRNLIKHMQTVSESKPGDHSSELIQQEGRHDQLRVEDDQRREEELIQKGKHGQEVHRGKQKHQEVKN